LQSKERRRAPHDPLGAIAATFPAWAATKLLVIIAPFENPVM
jgi:hypothetical protein